MKVGRKPLLVGIALIFAVAFGTAVTLMYPFVPWHHQQSEEGAAAIQPSLPLPLPEASPTPNKEPELQSVRPFMPTRVVVKSLDGILLDREVTEQIRPRFNDRTNTWELAPQANDGVGIVYSPEYDATTNTPKLEDRELPGNPSGTAEFGAHAQYGADTGFTALMQLPTEPTVLRDKQFIIIVYGPDGQELTYDNLQVHSLVKGQPQGDLDLNAPNTVQLTTCEALDARETVNNRRIVGKLYSAISPVG